MKILILALLDLSHVVSLEATEMEKPVQHETKKGRIVLRDQQLTAYLQGRSDEGKPYS